MSRIGRLPISIPSGVNLEIEGRNIKATGPKGELSLTLMRGIKAELANDQVLVSRSGSDPESIKSYGLMRTLIQNMVTGVSEGFNKSLEINGVGYRAAVSGNTVNLALGFSHPVEFKLPEGVAATVEKNVLTISGADKQLVGQVAADIRSLRKPEPYKGKGIKYAGERIRRKAGKTAVKGA